MKIQGRGPLLLLIAMVYATLVAGKLLPQYEYVEIPFETNQSQVYVFAFIPNNTAYFQILFTTSENDFQFSLYCNTSQQLATADKTETSPQSIQTLYLFQQTTNGSSNISSFAELCSADPTQNCIFTLTITPTQESASNLTIYFRPVSTNPQQPHPQPFTSSQSQIAVQSPLDESFPDQIFVNRYYYPLQNGDTALLNMAFLSNTVRSLIKVQSISDAQSQNPQNYFYPTLNESEVQQLYKQSSSNDQRWILQSQYTSCNNAIQSECALVVSVFSVSKSSLFPSEMLISIDTSSLKYKTIDQGIVQNANFSLLGNDSRTAKHVQPYLIQPEQFFTQRKFFQLNAIGFYLDSSIDLLPGQQWQSVYTLCYVPAIDGNQIICDGPFQENVFWSKPPIQNLSQIFVNVLLGAATQKTADYQLSWGGYELIQEYEIGQNYTLYVDQRTILAYSTADTYYNYTFSTDFQNDTLMIYGQFCSSLNDQTCTYPEDASSSAFVVSGTNANGYMLPAAPFGSFYVITLVLADSQLQQSQLPGPKQITVCVQAQQPQPTPSWTLLPKYEYVTIPFETNQSQVYVFAFIPEVTAYFQILFTTSENDFEFSLYCNTSQQLAAADKTETSPQSIQTLYLFQQTDGVSSNISSFAELCSADPTQNCVFTLTITPTQESGSSLTIYYRPVSNSIEQTQPQQFSLSLSQKAVQPPLEDSYQDQIFVHRYFQSLDKDDTALFNLAFLSGNVRALMKIDVLTDHYSDQPQDYFYPTLNEDEVQQLYKQTVGNNQRWNLLTQYASCFSPNEQQCALLISLFSISKSPTFTGMMYISLNTNTTGYQTMEEGTTQNGNFSLQQSGILTQSHVQPYLIESEQFFTQHNYFQLSVSGFYLDSNAVSSPYLQWQSIYTLCYVPAIDGNQIVCQGPFQENVFWSKPPIQNLSQIFVNVLLGATTSKTADYQLIWGGYELIQEYEIDQNYTLYVEQRVMFAYGTVDTYYDYTFSTDFQNDTLMIYGQFCSSLNDQTCTYPEDATSSLFVLNGTNANGYMLPAAPFGSFYVITLVLADQQLQQSQLPGPKQITVCVQAQQPQPTPSWTLLPKYEYVTIPFETNQSQVYVFAIIPNNTAYFQILFTTSENDFEFSLYCNTSQQLATADKTETSPQSIQTLYLFQQTINGSSNISSFAELCSADPTKNCIFTLTITPTQESGSNLTIYFRPVSTNPQQPHPQPFTSSQSQIAVQSPLDESFPDQIFVNRYYYPLQNGDTALLNMAFLSNYVRSLIKVQSISDAQSQNPQNYFYPTLNESEVQQLYKQSSSNDQRWILQSQYTSCNNAIQSECALVVSVFSVSKSSRYPSEMLISIDTSSLKYKTIDQGTVQSANFSLLGNDSRTAKHVQPYLIQPEQFFTQRKFFQLNASGFYLDSNVVSSPYLQWQSIYTLCYVPTIDGNQIICDGPFQENVFWSKPPIQNLSQIFVNVLLGAATQKTADYQLSWGGYEQISVYEIDQNYTLYVEQRVMFAYQIANATFNYTFSFALLNNTITVYGQLCSSLNEQNCVYPEDAASSLFVLNGTNANGYKLPTPVLHSYYVMTLVLANTQSQAAHLPGPQQITVNVAAQKPSPIPTPTPSQDKGLSGWAIFGIVAGSLLLAAIIFYVVRYYLLKRKQKKEAQENEPSIVSGEEFQSYARMGDQEDLQIVNQ